MTKTTGENLVVTWDNIVATITSWQEHPRYATGSYYTTLLNHGGHEIVNGTIADEVLTIPLAQRDEFCEKVRYWYGGCINLDQSRAIDPKLLK